MKETIKQSLSPLNILNIFQEEHRLCSPLDPEADPEVELSFNSTIDEWRSARDLIPWKPLSAFLNKEFNISPTAEEWKAVLVPPSKRTLKDVCELISKCATYQDIKPIKLLGQECLSSAVFLTLKKYLENRQVDVSNLRPSTLVVPYLENHFSEMIEQVNIIANGKRVFDKLELKQKKAGFLNYISLFDKDRYTFLTGNINTFRDLVFKIIEVNNQPPN